MMKDCPRYLYCSVPLCPLDEEMGKRVYIKGEPVCTLPKTIRKRLGKDLPNKGMFKREIAAQKSYKERLAKGTSEIGKFAFKSQKQAHLQNRGAKRGN
jgi:hypothetical protein